MRCLYTLSYVSRAGRVSRLIRRCHRILFLPIYRRRYLSRVNRQTIDTSQFLRKMKSEKSITIISQCYLHLYIFLSVSKCIDLNKLDLLIKRIYFIDMIYHVTSFLVVSSCRFDIWNWRYTNQNIFEWYYRLLFQLRSKCMQCSSKLYDEIHITTCVRLSTSLWKLSKLMEASSFSSWILF